MLKLKNKLTQWPTSFNDGKEGTTVSNYKLVDPKQGAKVESLTTEEGTYTVDPTTGEVSLHQLKDLLVQQLLSQ